MQITRGKIQSAQKVVLYGPEGIGKSTFASQFPNPVFIDTEGSTKHMDVARTPKPSSWAMLLQQVQHFKNNSTECDTLIIDTADWAERLCINEICAKSQKTGIEDFGYGKGYVYLMEEFGRLLNLLEDLVELSINVVFTAHAQMRKFEQPNEMGAYDRWEMKLQKKTAPMVKEWADMVLFANYKTHVINVDGQGAEKGKNKAQGGKRVMYTTHHPCWDAKNRHDLPEELPLEYSAIAHCIPSRNTTTQPTPQQPPEPPKTEEPPAPQPEEKTEPVPEPPPEPEPQKEETSSIPKPLADLMATNHVLPEELLKAIYRRGHYPEDTPFENLDPAFIDGWCIAFWPQVLELIQQIRDEERDDMPF